MRIVALGALSLLDGRVTGFGGKITRMAGAAGVENVLSRAHPRLAVVTVRALPLDKGRMQGNESRSRRRGGLEQRRFGRNGLNLGRGRFFRNLEEKVAQSITGLGRTTQNDEPADQDDSDAAFR